MSDDETAVLQPAQRAVHGIPARHSGELADLASREIELDPAAHRTLLEQCQEDGEVDRALGSRPRGLEHPCADLEDPGIRTRLEPSGDVPDLMARLLPNLVSEPAEGSFPALPLDS